MRKRKNPNNAIHCYKFYCWPKDYNSDLLPDRIYGAAKRQQSLWNALVAEQERRYQQWKDVHEPKPDPKIGEIANTYPKPDRGYWDDFDRWARQAVAGSGLNWEMGPEVLDRYYSVYRRLRQGGGIPRLKRRLDHFALAHRYTGGGTSLHKLESTRQKRFRIAFPNAETYVDNSRDRRRERLTSAWFGIDDEQIGLNVIVHRAIPADAIVKRVALTGLKQSPAMRWQFSIVFTVEEEPQEPTEASKERVGIDVGWRKIGDRLRVAVAYDGAKHEELYIPLAYHAKGLGEVSLERKRAVQHMKDTLLERAKSALREKLPALGIELPREFTRMRNAGLIRLMNEWQSAGVRHGAATLLQEWKQDNDRLTRKALMIDNRMKARREHEYRNFASRLARNYQLIRVEKLDLKNMSRRENVKGEYVLEAAAENRNYAACGELLAAIRNAAKGRVEEVHSSYTTSICAKCGEPFEAGEALQGRCTAGHVRDQDWNAAENIFGKPPVIAERGKYATM